MAAARDRCISQVIAEIYDATGADGAIIVENGEASETTFEFVEGVRWNEGLVSDTLLRTRETTLRLLEPRILITDCDLESPDQFLPLLDECIAAGERRLFIIAAQVREPVLALLHANRQQGCWSPLLQSAPLRSAADGGHSRGPGSADRWTVLPSRGRRTGRCCHRRPRTSTSGVGHTDRFWRARWTWYPRCRSRTHCHCQG
jgi:hypothetical protein